jgi:hypothetical protein
MADFSGLMAGKKEELEVWRCHLFKGGLREPHLLLDLGLGFNMPLGCFGGVGLA